MIRRDGTSFAARALQGFALTHPSLVRAVTEGVVARHSATEDAPLFVIGGGAGHFPAFTGYVGEGLAGAAVHGDIFASPSEAAIVGVVRAARPSGDVILGYGNYAGDRLNFGAAARTLRDHGYRVHELVVTDDVASASEHAQRRGIAGDVIVFKVCGAAIAAGMAVDAAVAVARRANERTRTLGVALSGCTIPGAAKPLFTVDDGAVAVGLGIHGEPGIETIGSLTEDELASLLVDRAFAELTPLAERRAAVVLNGMGSVGAEALLSLWPAVEERLCEHGVIPVAPLIGSFVSSLDMDGVSLSVCLLDSELEELWTAPARTAVIDRRVGDISVAERVEMASAFAPSDAVEGPVGAALKDVVAMLVDEEAQLGDLDALAGDGDHGRGMLAGARAALAASAAIPDPRAALRAAGAAWAARAGGTSGALWGAMLVAAADALGEESSLDEQVRTAVTAAHDELVHRGGAHVGDKTMLDAIAPFAEQIQKPGDMSTVWADAAVSARRAAEATRDLTPQRGRSKTHPARSLGHPDPGAVSFALIVQTLTPLFSQKE